jgi:hypothetical protein
MFSRFQSTFGVSLHDYWIDNARGLDVEKFRKEVLKSKTGQFLAAVKAKFGKDGVTVVKRLVPKRQPA